jgi:hypothetical protein
MFMRLKQGYFAARFLGRLLGAGLAGFGDTGAAIMRLTASSNLTPCNLKSTGLGINVKWPRLQIPASQK